jgi:hypothetical protein
MYVSVAIHTMLSAHDIYQNVKIQKNALFYVKSYAVTFTVIL